MTAKAKKIYAIFSGRLPGLYNNWDEASAQINGFKGAKYKSFGAREEAIQWLRECILAASESVDQKLIDLIKSHDESSNTFDQSRKNLERSKIIIHTDGGASPNPGIGGYGVVLQRGDLRKEFSAGYELTTNNRMEVMACIVALQSLKESSRVVLHSDSKYVVDTIAKGWAKGWRRKGWHKSDGKMAENVDLWEQLLNLLEMHSVDFKWVRSHAGNKENERCDLLANEAKNSTILLQDIGYTRFSK
ncbi:ribonuclease HI [bacterium]|nr:ribonuclease HI [bacterium]